MMAEGCLHGLPIPRPDLHIGRAYAACGDDIAERIDPAGLAGEQAVARRSILARQAFDDARQRVAERGSARSWRPLSWCRRRGWGVARRAAVGRPESDAPRSLFPRASTAAPARAAVMVRIEVGSGCDT